MSRAMIAVFSLVAVGGWFITLGVNADEPTTNLPPRTIPFGSRVMPGRAEISQTTESEVTTRLVGIARPSRLADLRSSVSGPIIEVAVRDNDRVKAGDVLVRLDDRIQQAAVKVAQVEALRVGSLSLAQIELRLAEQQLQRVTRAFERQAGSQFEVDEKTSVRDQARAKVTIEQESQARAQANLERALAELDEYTIRAPFDGDVVQVHQQPGATVDRTIPVVTIAERKSLHVQLNLPLAEFGTVTPGSEFLVQADDPVKRSLRARVRSVSPYTNSASRTFRVELEIDNSDERLPAGFTVRKEGPTVFSDVADRREPLKSGRR